MSAELSHCKLALLFSMYCPICSNCPHFTCAACGAGFSDTGFSDTGLLLGELTWRAFANCTCLQCSDVLPPLVGACCYKAVIASFFEHSGFLLMYFLKCFLIPSPTCSCTSSIPRLRKQLCAWVGWTPRVPGDSLGPALLGAVSVQHSGLVGCCFSGDSYLSPSRCLDAFTYVAWF